MNRDVNGQESPFEYLHIIIDSHQEVDEVVPDNNGVVIKASEVLPVDPSLFSVDKTDLKPSEQISVAGEGLGPEPGKVMRLSSEVKNLLRTENA